ncbi:MAG: hypothetical protein C4326_01205 [Ignavibacteria bacterium]
MIVLLVLLQYFSITSAELNQAERVARRVFPSTTHIARLPFDLRRRDNDSLRLLVKHVSLPDTLVLLCVYDNHDVLGYAVAANVKGKDQPITFCVVVDEALRITDMDILTYREPYGGEVRQASWLKQFFGKSPEDPLRAGREIRNITGATISVRSVTQGVKDLLAILRALSPCLPHTSEVAR